jgi:hypothetical protein
MKNYLFIVVLSIILFSCKNEGCTDPVAINFDSSSNKNDGSCEYIYNLNIRFALTDNNIKLSDNDFISFDNNTLRIERFKLYFTDISVASQSKIDNISDVFLFDLENESTHNFSATISQDSFNELTFGVGLSEKLNSTTPIEYETNHPLGIDNGTHWTMNNADSYIFAMIEGKFDTIGDGSFFNRTYHLAHNDLLKMVNLQKEVYFNNEFNKTIEINIELKEVFEAIDLSSTLPHQSNNSPLAHQIMDNIKNAFEIQ